MDANSLVGVSYGGVENKFEIEGVVGGYVVEYEEKSFDGVELQLVGVYYDAEDGYGEAGEDDGRGDDDKQHSQAADAAAAFAALTESIASVAAPLWWVNRRLHGGVVFTVGFFL